MSEDTLTITDNRTGKQYQVPIEYGTIRAMDLRQIKVSDDDFGLMTYDPAFMNTASCKSRIRAIAVLCLFVALFKHSRCDLFENLRANSAGDVKRIHARIKLHDIRADYFSF
jgi:hypothetical protein